MITLSAYDAFLKDWNKIGMNAFPFQFQNETKLVSLKLEVLLDANQWYQIHINSFEYRTIKTFKCIKNTSSILHTLNKHQKICVIFGTSENSDWVLQWWSMRKLIWKHKLITNTFVTKIILDILYLILGRANLHWIFSSSLRMPLILTDFPTGSGS